MFIVEVYCALSPTTPADAIYTNNHQLVRGIAPSERFAATRRAEYLPGLIPHA
jgi:hypothetical protein